MRRARAVSKYHSKKVSAGGEAFDSRKEYRRWCELLLLQRAGQISDLRRQVEFELIPAQREPDAVGARGGIKRGKLIEQRCCYIADFVYTENGQTVVEDVKGYKRGTAYAVFSIKRKLLLFTRGIRIREV
jgi:hypothetical protein